MLIWISSDLHRVESDMEMFQALPNKTFTYKWLIQTCKVVTNVKGCMSEGALDIAIVKADILTSQTQV